MAMRSLGSIINDLLGDSMGTHKPPAIAPVPMIPPMYNNGLNPLVPNAHALPTPGQWLQAQAQQNPLQQAYSQQNALQQAYYPQPGSERFPLVTMNVRHMKINQQMDKLTQLLPMSIAAKIIRLDYFEADKTTPACYVITFVNQRTLEFGEVDTFPTDEHIARIALDCP